MFISLRNGILKTQAKVSRIGNHYPALEMHTQTPRGDEIAEDITRIVVSGRIGPVPSFLFAEGLPRIHVLEGNADSLSAQYVREKHPDITKEVPTVETGDGILGFNAKFYESLEDGDKEHAFEHEFWHLYLAKVFPQHAQGRMTLHRRCPYKSLVIPNFLDHLEHFFLGTAAIIAGRGPFVAANSRWVLEYVIEKCKGEYGLASFFGSATPIQWSLHRLFAGLTLGYVRPFWLADDPEVFRQNIDDHLLKIMNWESEGGLGVRQPGEKLLKRVFDVCYMEGTKGARGDVNMEDLSDTISKIINE